LTMTTPSKPGVTPCTLRSEGFAGGLGLWGRGWSA